MNQVHKETLSHVENALPNRQGLDVEIFGMEGLPEEVRKQHEERIVKNYFDAQRERFEATGNPPPGEGRPTKKIKIEAADDLKKRFAEFRARKASGKATGANGAPTAPPGAVQSPGQTGSPGTFVSRPRSTKFALDHADRTLELTFQPSPALWTTRLPELSSKWRISTSRIQPIRSALPSCPTSLSPDRTEPAPAPRLPSKLLSRPSAPRLPRRRCINSRRTGGWRGKPGR